ncbi:MAG: hypothetical protein K2H60_04190 [Muribaculaceae bacterium]|nr:hypothetical protein [Muribaculaceae bacterium]
MSRIIPAPRDHNRQLPSFPRRLFQPRRQAILPHNRLPGEQCQGGRRNRYLFGDKERLPENGINEYDFAAWQYVASQMRFTAPDPLAEERPGLSPYIYCNSNPIMLIDPSGKQSISPTGNTANPLNLPVFPDNTLDWTQGLGNDNTDWLGIGQGENGISLLFDASKDGKSLLDRSVDGANNAAASFGVANGTKDLIIEYAVGSKPAGTLGKYVKVSNVLSSVGGGINAACALYNGYNYMRDGGDNVKVMVKYGVDFIAGGAGVVAGIVSLTNPVGLSILIFTTGYYILDVTTHGFGLDYSPKKQINK